MATSPIFCGHKADMSKILGDNPFASDDDATLAAVTRGTQTDVPDAASPPVDSDDDDLFLGGEAVVPDREYGPPIPSRLPNVASVGSEVRELERRVRARLTPAFPIEVKRRLPLEFLWTRYRQFAMRDRSDVVDEFGRDPVFAARIEPLVDFLYRRYFRVDVAGVEHIPKAGRALIVVNHSGTVPYDGVMLMHAVRSQHSAHREVRPLVENFVFHFPYVGTFINRMGGVRACQENAQRLLEDDQAIAVFPEGIKGIGKLFRDRYQLQRFGRGGFIKLALRTATPIIPAAIVGAEEIHPMIGKITWFAKSIGIPYVPVTPTFPLLGPLGAVPLPTKWFIRFGEPLDPAGQYGRDGASDRILVNRLAETVRSTIQSMIDRTLSERHSVVFG
jgi:1-acyl-sn-glycerol-3-phosphate acyltransferase